jgi:hypothetical protein
MLYGHYALEKLAENVQEDRLREARQDRDAAEALRASGVQRTTKPRAALLNLALRSSAK